MSTRDQEPQEGASREEILAWGRAECEKYANYNFNPDCCDSCTGMFNGRGKYKRCESCRIHRGVLVVIVLTFISLIAIQLFSLLNLK